MISLIQTLSGAFAARARAAAMRCVHVMEVPGRSVLDYGNVLGAVLGPLRQHEHDVNRQTVHKATAFERENLVQFTECVQHFSNRKVVVKHVSAPAPRDDLVDLPCPALLSTGHGARELH
jgi:hypothetical protein